MAANIFNLQIPEECDEKCCICQDFLSIAQTYTLPECNHIFHTNCIVTWFRNRPSTQEEWLSDGNCPLCGNKGINYRKNTRRWWGRRNVGRCEYSLSRMSEMRAVLKKPNPPKELKRLFKKLETHKKDLQNKKNEFANFKKDIKIKEVNYKETQKQMSDYRSIIWRKKRSVHTTENAIIHFPVIPIIIPVKVNIN